MFNTVQGDRQVVCSDQIITVDVISSRGECESLLRIRCSGCTNTKLKCLVGEGSSVLYSKNDSVTIDCRNNSVRSDITAADVMTNRDIGNRGYRDRVLVNVTTARSGSNWVENGSYIPLTSV